MVQFSLRMASGVCAVTACLVAGGMLLAHAPGPAKAPRNDKKAELKSEGEMLPAQGGFWDFFGGSSRRDPDEEMDDEEYLRPEPQDRPRLNHWGTYHTVCVRLCDGFSFPISYATTRSRFQSDAKRCEEACPNRSRLFVRPSDEEGTENMADLNGNPYSSLQNASRYLTEYVPNCTCRGNPWDEQAQARHRAYAEAAKTKKDGPLATASKALPHLSKIRQPRPIARPDRVARGPWQEEPADDD